MGFDKPEREQAPADRSQDQPDAPNNQSPMPPPVSPSNDEYAYEPDCLCEDCTGRPASDLDRRQSRSRSNVTVLEEEGNCIVCLEMRADKPIRRLISGELTIYSVVRTSPELLHLDPVSAIATTDLLVTAPFVVSVT
jgi:hypothetical protein